MGPEWDFASPVPGIRPQARRLIRTLNVARGCYIKVSKPEFEAVCRDMRDSKTRKPAQQKTTR